MHPGSIPGQASKLSQDIADGGGQAAAARRSALPSPPSGDHAANAPRGRTIACANGDLGPPLPNRHGGARFGQLSDTSD